MGPEIIKDKPIVTVLRFRKFDEKALTSFAELNLGYEVAIDMYASPRKSHQMDVLSAISNVVSVGIVTDYIEHLKRLFAIQPKLRRLAIVCKNSSSSTTHEDLSHESYLTTKDDSYNVPPVTELHLDGLLGITPYSPSVRSNQVNERIALLNNVQWHLLRSLNLNSGLLIERFLTHYGDRLSSVRHLSLSVYDSSQDDPWAEHLGGVEATANFFRTSRFAQRLLSLELRGYTLRFPLSCIKSPTLQTLRFHNYENDGRALAISIRPASDIRHLGQNCPDLCYLAIDFAKLKKLFHPAAIPGVETDLAVYPFLQAIAEIPKLSHLHLFPPYAQMVAGRITYAQPFTDDDMVIRLFKHIKTYQILHKQSQSAESSNPFFNTISETSPLSPSLFAPPQYPHPTLKHLLITSDNLFASWVHPFNPQSWHVFEPSNGRFFMTLRQSERDYEQRQVWEGERRLRTEIRRDRYPRHYQSGFPDGTGLGWFDMS